MTQPHTNDNPGVAAPGLDVGTENQRQDQQLIQREALQDLAVTLDGWAVLAVRAAHSASAADVLAILRGARKTLLVALEEARALVAMEGATR